MKLSFHGAAGTVTGSCHLVEAAGRRILIDCGLLQGSCELAHENADPFGFDAAAIDCVLLTHAHPDHCGRLTLLMQRGFRGEIIATSPTHELTLAAKLPGAWRCRGCTRLSSFSVGKLPHRPQPFAARRRSRPSPASPVASIAIDAGSGTGAKARPRIDVLAAAA
jgi:glyoxylase-like metal-dependent hydrolase (beta-lactamase superfamily II)